MIFPISHPYSLSLPAQRLRQDEENKNAAEQREAAHDDEGQGHPDAAKGGNGRGNNPSDATAERTRPNCCAPELRSVQMDSSFSISCLISVGNISAV